MKKKLKHGDQFVHMGITFTIDERLNNFKLTGPAAVRMEEIRKKFKKMKSLPNLDEL